MSESINIKSCFTSRYGDKGYIVEADFSQLEVIGTAVVSGDPMMKKDILDGIDSHSQSAAWLHPTYSYEEIREGYLADDPHFIKLRKAAKAPRFELQYGAGANSIARNNGLTKEQAQGFIDRYYDRYSVLKQFQTDLRAAVEASIRPSERRSPSGYPLGVGKWQSTTGRIYTFQEQPAPQWMQDKGIMASISPTQIANYPMQGFSTGDIVPEVIGRLNRELLRDTFGTEGRIQLINTIHDSILCDVHDAVLTRAAFLLKSVMQKAPEYMKERFGVVVDLPLHVDIEYGRNWAQMMNYKF